MGHLDRSDVNQEKGDYIIMYLCLWENVHMVYVGRTLHALIGHE